MSVRVRVVPVCVVLVCGACVDACVCEGEVGGGGERDYVCVSLAHSLLSRCISGPLPCR